jgi:pseudoazurin
LLQRKVPGHRRQYGSSVEIPGLEPGESKWSRTMMDVRKLALGALGAVLLAVPALAADYEVKMLNKGADNQPMVFEPAYLKIQPGDTVRFVPTDKGHDAETIPGMLPEGAKPFKGKLSQEISVTFEKSGVYGIRCTPHYGMGMVGLIEVGDNPANLDAARQVKMPPIATKRMTVLFDQSAKSKTAQAGTAKKVPGPVPDRRVPDIPGSGTRGPVPRASLPRSRS